MKTLVLYLYREDSLTKGNLSFFIRHGVRQTSDTDYVIIVNDYTCTVDIPAFPNVQILRRENSFDLNAFHDAFDHIDRTHYDFFIFLNSSCVGPFIPPIVSKPWEQLFTDQLTGKIKMVGPILEVPPDHLGSKCLKEFKVIQPEDKSVPFLHTYMFATDREGLELLFRYSVLTRTKLSKDDVIHVNERLATSCVLNEGFGVRSFLYRYRNIDFTDKKNWQASRWSGDSATCPEIPGNYGGIDVNPFEVVFVKNIRGAHSHRSKAHSGISDTLGTYLDHYMRWISTV